MADNTSRGGRIIGGGDDDSGPGPEIMAAETLSGDQVVNTAGENLGEIQSIMLDVPRGRIAYAVLSFGGILGLGSKLFAIPWELLTLDANNKRFILAVDRERLKQAPGFDKDHWPSAADYGLAQQAYTYYGTKPYWS